MKPIAVITTVAERAEAQRIATALVERRLAACGQISEIESIYRWKGETRRDTEFRLLLKTTDERYTEVERAIRDLHSYELPAIYALPIDQAYAPYAAWIADNADGR